MRIVCYIFFFFSSRRRHTTCSRDWSSDVCSSDLLAHAPVDLRELGAPDLLGAGAQRGDRGHDLERGAPRLEALRLLADELLGARALGAAQLECLGNDR